MSLTINGVELSDFESQSVRTEIENAIDRWEHNEACALTCAYGKLARERVAAFKRVLRVMTEPTECTTAR